jgi:hypothetical protein
VRDVVRSLERATPEEQWTTLCYLAGGHVALDPAERSAAVRRAALLLAAGGDPRRELELYGRAVGSVAADLDSPDARSQLRAGLSELAADVTGLHGAGEALRLLEADDDLAWQCFACALLAESLADDEA